MHFCCNPGFTQDGQRLSFIILDRSLPRPPNPHLLHLFLQALPVQADRRRRSRNIPAMRAQLPKQKRNLKFAFCFAQVFLLQAVILSFLAALRQDWRASQNLLRQIAHAQLRIPAKHQAALQGVFQFADIARPIILFECRQRLFGQNRRASENVFRESAKTLPQRWRCLLYPCATAAIQWS